MATVLPFSEPVFSQESYSNSQILTPFGCRWSPGMSLRDILSFALCNNSEIIDLGWDLDRAGFESRIIKSSYMPTLVGKALVPALGFSNKRELTAFSVESAMEVWGGGRRYSESKRAQSKADAAQYRQDTKRYEVMRHCVELYYDIWAGNKHLEILNRLHSASTYSLGTLRQLISVGFISEIDLVRFSVTERRYASQIIEGELRVDELKRNFKVLLGIGPEVDVNVKDIQVKM